LKCVGVLLCGEVGARASLELPAAAQGGGRQLKAAGGSSRRRAACRPPRSFRLRRNERARAVRSAAFYEVGEESGRLKAAAGADEGARRALCGAKRLTSPFRRRPLGESTQVGGFQFAAFFRTFPNAAFSHNPLNWRICVFVLLFLYTRRLLLCRFFGAHGKTPRFGDTADSRGRALSCLRQLKAAGGLPPAPLVSAAPKRARPRSAKRGTQLTPYACGRTRPVPPQAEQGGGAAKPRRLAAFAFCFAKTQSVRRRSPLPRNVPDLR